MQSGNVIFKLDDILINTTATVYRLIRQKWSRFNRWFIDFGPLNDNDVYDREYKNIYEWLLKPCFRNLDFDRFSAVINNISSDFDTLIGNNVYKTYHINDIARNTVLNPAYIESPTINNIYIICDYIDDDDKKIKTDIINKYFKHNKTIIIYRKLGETLSSILKRDNISWNLIVTDDTDDIRDLAENCVRARKEFLLPKAKYVKLPIEVKTLIEYDQGSVNYYDPKNKKELG